MFCRQSAVKVSRLSCHINPEIARVVELVHASRFPIAPVALTIDQSLEASEANGVYAQNADSVAATL